MENKSKIRLIRVVGTVIVVCIGIYVAVVMTFGVKVSKDTYYVLNLPESLYEIKTPEKKLRISIGVGFSSEAVAEEYKLNSDKISSIVRTAILNAQSINVVGNLNKNTIKSIIYIELGKNNIPVEFVRFNGVPKIM